MKNNYILREHII